MSTPILFLPANKKADPIKTLSSVVSLARSELINGTRRTMYASGDSFYLQQQYEGAGCGIVQYDFFVARPFIWKLDITDPHLAIIYMLQGDAEVQVNLSPPLLLPEGTCVAATVNNKYLAFNFPVAHTKIIYTYYSRSFLDELRFVAHTFSFLDHMLACNPYLPLYPPIRIDPEIYSQLDLTSRYKGSQARFRVFMRSRALDILLSYLNNVEQPANRIELKKADRIYLAKKLIDAREGKRISLSELCRKTNLSRAELQKGFREAMNISVTAYQQQARVRIAASMLLNDKSRSVYDIALRLGFAEESSFIKLYKKYFGITPHQYRLKFRK